MADAKPDAGNQPAETTVTESIISKITMASIGCKPSAVSLLPDGENELPIARLYGTLDKVGHQDDKNTGTPFTFFVGNFEAINMQTGEVFKSGKMFLPKGISELVESEVTKNPGADIAFAFEVRSIKANNPIKYSYKVLPLVSPTVADPLKILRDKVLAAGAIDVKRLTGKQKGTGTTVEATGTAAEAAKTPPVAGARKAS